MHRLLALAAIYCASASSIAHAQERITVERAVELALKGNLRLLSVEKRALAGHDQALGVGARLLPSVHLSEEFQHWDCPAAFSLANFSSGAECLADAQRMTPPNATPALMPIVARRQETSSFVAAVDQPLLGLLHIGYDFAAQRATAKANDAGVKVTQAATVQAVRTAYLQYFEARALADIAAASMKELREQVQVSEARLKAGVITNADLLRVVVAEANAQQQGIAADTQAAIIKTQILDGIGLRSDENVELSEPATLLAAATQPLPAALEARRQADTRRPEVAQAELGHRAAGDTRTARYLSLLPEIDAEGA
jgi:outer membrane protein TolC